MRLQFDPACVRQDQDRYGTAREVLLISQLLVRGQQQVESLFGFREQFAVGDLRPSHFKCGDDIVTVEKASQRNRRSLIEENAHVATLLPGSLRQTPGLRELVRGSLRETTRE